MRLDSTLQPDGSFWKHPNSIPRTVKIKNGSLNITANYIYGAEINRNMDN